MLAMMVLVAVLGRVTSIEHQVVEVAGSTDGVHLLVFVRGRAGSTDNVGDLERIHAWAMASTCVEGLS